MTRDQWIFMCHMCTFTQFLTFDQSYFFYCFFFLHFLQLYHLLLISNFFAYLFYSLKIQIAVKSHELFN